MGGRQSTGGWATEADRPKMKGANKGSPNNSVQGPEPLYMAMKNYEKKAHICQLLPILFSLTVRQESGITFRRPDFEGDVLPKNEQPLL